MKKTLLYFLAAAIVVLGAYPSLRKTQLGSCLAYAFGGLREVEQDRSKRFLGKVHEDTARCRGGDQAVEWRNTRGSIGNNIAPPETNAAAPLVQPASLAS